MDERLRGFICSISGVARVFRGDACLASLGGVHARRRGAGGGFLSGDACPGGRRGGSGQCISGLLQRGACISGRRYSVIGSWC